VLVVHVFGTILNNMALIIYGDSVCHIYNAAVHIIHVLLYYNRMMDPTVPKMLKSYPSDSLR